LLPQAFGALLGGIVVAGSLWIIYRLNTNMMAASCMMSMGMQP
jgi:heme/copper-type cytochrome/quinol oxidase subunit 4